MGEREGAMKKSQEDEKSPLSDLGPCARYLLEQKQVVSSLHLSECVLRILFNADLICVM